MGWKKEREGEERRERKTKRGGEGERKIDR